MPNAFLAVYGFLSALLPLRHRGGMASRAFNEVAAGPSRTMVATNAVTRSCGTRPQQFSSARIPFRPSCSLSCARRSATISAVPRIALPCRASSLGHRLQPVAPLDPSRGIAECPRGLGILQAARLNSGRNSLELSSGSESACSSVSPISTSQIDRTAVRGHKPPSCSASRADSAPDLGRAGDYGLQRHFAAPAIILCSCLTSVSGAVPAATEKRID